MQPNREYLNRIRKASPPELIYRLKRLHLSRKLQESVLNGGFRPEAPPLTGQQIAAICLPELQRESERHTSQTHEAILQTIENTTTRFGQYGKRMTSLFSGDIETGSGAPDIRLVWESGRLQSFFDYLHSPILEPDPVLRENGAIMAKEHLFGWLHANPFVRGPHWMSPMECGLRIPVFVYVLQKFPNLHDEEIEFIGVNIYEHAWWIFRNLSLYASLGNHTVCEASGLIFAGALFGEGGESRQWLERGIDLFESELDHQILDDGGPAEQSLSYHRFVMDIYGLCADLLEKNRLHDTRRIVERLKLAETFLATFTVAGKTPAIGDSDDGHAVGPNLHPRRPVPSRKPEPVTTFDASGYTLFRPAEDTLLTFDHGPLGMAPLFNHGHADALSVTLTVNGRPILVDPGTYRYNGVPEHRRYFKGTRAHNTVTVDDQDQALQKTGFIWSAPFRTRMLAAHRVGEGFLIAAENDGYARLAESVWHKRTLFMIDPTHFLIRDTFRGKGVHSYQLNFHLHPDVAAKATAHGWRLDHAGTIVHVLLLDGGEDFHLVCGQKKPLMGWYSPAYGVLQETSVLSLTRRGVPGKVTFPTGITLGAPLSTDRFLEKAQCLLNAA